MSELGRYRPDKSRQEEVEKPPLRLLSQVERAYLPTLPPAKRKEYFKGVLTGVKGGGPNGSIVIEDSSSAHLTLQVAEAAVAFHDQIYEATKKWSPASVRCEGLLMTVGFRYTQEPQHSGLFGRFNPSLDMRLYALYGEDHRGDPRFELAHRLMMATFLKEIAPQGQNDHLDIEVGYGTSGVNYWTPDQELLELLEKS